MRRYTAVLAALLMIASGAGVSLALDRVTNADASGVENASPRPTTSAGTAPSTVRLAFGGDVHFEGRIGDVLAGDPSDVLAGVDRELSSADIAMVNLETAVTSRGTKADKQYAFRASASAYTALKAGGVDLASLANNHGMDYGRVGLERTLDAAQEADFPLLGAGRDAEEAYRPHVMEVNGQRIAFIAATQVLDDNLAAEWTATDDQPGLASAKDVPRLAAAVTEARRDADTVVLFLHWGVEEATCPSDNQRELARQMKDAGADIIVGSHTHRLQGAGRMDGAFVAYGLGNFVFYTESGPGTETGVLLVDVAGRDVKSYDWVPARLVNQLPRTIDGDDADRADRRWEGLRDCTGLTP